MWHHLSSQLARNSTFLWFNKQACSPFYLWKIMQLSRTKGQQGNSPSESYWARWPLIYTSLNYDGKYNLNDVTGVDKNVYGNVHGSSTISFKHRWQHLSSVLARNPTLYWFKKQAYSTFYMCKIMQLSQKKGQLLVSNIDGTTWAHSWRGTLLCNGLLSKLTPHYTCAIITDKNANYLFQT